MCRLSMRKVIRGCVPRRGLGSASTRNSRVGVVASKATTRLAVAETISAGNQSGQTFVIQVDVMDGFEVSGHPSMKCGDEC